MTWWKTLDKPEVIRLGSKYSKWTSHVNLTARPAVNVWPLRPEATAPRWSGNFSITAVERAACAAASRRLICLLSINYSIQKLYLNEFNPTLRLALLIFQRDSCEFLWSITNPHGTVASWRLATRKKTPPFLQQRFSTLLMTFVLMFFSTIVCSGWIMHALHQRTVFITIITIGTNEWT